MKCKRPAYPIPTYIRGIKNGALALWETVRVGDHPIDRKITQACRLAVLCHQTGDGRAVGRRTRHQRRMSLIGPKGIRKVDELICGKKRIERFKASTLPGEIRWPLWFDAWVEQAHLVAGKPRDGRDISTFLKVVLTVPGRKE